MFPAKQIWTARSQKGGVGSFPKLLPSDQSPPYSPISASPRSELSLGGRIEAFIRDQRSFSDDLRCGSPYLIDSRDEIEQVLVDHEFGLVLNTSALATTDDERDEEESKEAKEEEKEAEKEDAGGRTIHLKLNQSLITNFFASTLQKIKPVLQQCMQVLCRPMGGKGSRFKTCEYDLY